MESGSSTIETIWLSHPNADSFWDVAGSLQMSLSDDFVSHLPPQSETDAGFKRGRKPAGTCSPSAKITKRKPRASKRSTTTATTYIIADPANFRQMVQHVTGVQGEPGIGSSGPEQQQQQAGGPGLLQELGTYMPTFDTSALLFEQAADGLGGLFGAGGGQTFDFGPFATFPTLESWGAM